VLFVDSPGYLVGWLERDRAYIRHKSPDPPPCPAETDQGLPPPWLGELNSK
jgi:hypothetical protein